MKAALENIRSWWNSPGIEADIECMWLGQAGFLLRCGALRIVIDPYLSDSLARKYHGKPFSHRRMMEPPIRPEEIPGADLLLCTHEHGDHLDPDTIPGICASSPSLRVVLPRYSAALGIQRGVDARRIIALNAGEVWDSGIGCSVSALPAAHEDILTDHRGNLKFLGYLIQSEGHTLYHSGDTIPNRELEACLEECPRIDIAFLPCNGRDETRRSRGVPGNFTTEEAADYHRRFNFQHTLLHHFGMFDFNTIHPPAAAEFVNSSGLSESITIPKPGELYRVFPCPKGTRTL